MVENLKWTGWTSNLTFNLHQINLTLYCMCLCMVEYDIVIAIYFTCNWYVEHINAHVVKLFSNLSCCIDRINVAWFLVQIAWTWPACYIWSICYIMNALLLIYQRKTVSEDKKFMVKVTIPCKYGRVWRKHLDQLNTYGQFVIWWMLYY